MAANGVTQESEQPSGGFEDATYYLVDGINLMDYAESDQITLESSLKKFHTAKNDTGKVLALNNICKNMLHEDWKRYQRFQYHFILKARKIATNKRSKKVLDQSLMAALGNLGYIYQESNQVEKAIEFYQLSLKFSIELGEKKSEATNYNNIGLIYYRRGLIQKALEYYYKSLQLEEELESSSGIAASLNNIGALYQEQGDIDKALELFKRSYALEEEIEDFHGMGSSLNNIASIYAHRNDTLNAFEYHRKGLVIKNRIGDLQGVSSTLNNMAVIYNQYGHKERALLYYMESLKIREKLGDNMLISFSLVNLANFYCSIGKIEKAYLYANRSFKLTKELGFVKEISKSAEVLSKIYEKQGEGMKALEMYKLHVKMKDSINNEATQKATIRQQTKYEFEKAQIVKENESKEEARIKAEATGRRNNLQYSLIFLGILILFGVILSLGFIKVSPNVAEGIIFFAFLILFEFLLVFTEPYLEEYTNGEPMYNLFANSVLALLIFPVHAILEKLLKKRIVK